MSVITLSLNFLNTRKWKQKQVVMLKGLNSRQESWEKHMSWNSTNYAKMNAVLQLSLEFFVKFNQCMRTDFCNLLNLFGFFFSVLQKLFKKFYDHQVTDDFCSETETSQRVRKWKEDINNQFSLERWWGRVLYG